MNIHSFVCSVHNFENAIRFLVSNWILYRGRRDKFWIVFVHLV